MPQSTSETFIQSYVPAGLDRQVNEHCESPAENRRDLGWMFTGLSPIFRQIEKLGCGDHLHPWHPGRLKSRENDTTKMDYWELKLELDFSKNLPHNVSVYRKRFHEPTWLVEKAPSQ